jgi:hypothetical protein
MSKFYSKNGEEPQSVPFLILPDGRTRTGDDYTEEELRLCEYTGPYDVPTYDENFEIIQWDSENLEYKLIDHSFDHYMNILRSIRNRELDITDKIMIEDFPISENQKLKFLDYRDWLRHLPEAIDGYTSITETNSDYVPKEIYQIPKTENEFNTFFYENKEKFILNSQTN